MFSRQWQQQRSIALRQRCSSRKAYFQKVYPDMDFARVYGKRYEKNGEMVRGDSKPTISNQNSLKSPKKRRRAA